VLHLDPEHDSDRARGAFDSHLSRAKWMTKHGYGTCSVVLNIVAEYPGAEPREITGLKSNADVNDWVNGDRRVAWLRSQGYAKVTR
jgi:hypothetical protein